MVILSEDREEKDSPARGWTARPKVSARDREIQVTTDPVSKRAFTLMANPSFLNITRGNAGWSVLAQKRRAGARRLPGSTFLSTKMPVMAAYFVGFPAGAICIAAMEASTCFISGRPTRTQLSSHSDESALAMLMPP